MQSLTRQISLWAIIILGIQTASHAQMVKFIMRSQIDCDSLFHIELKVRASTFSLPLSFNLGSSSVLLNYDANSFTFEKYAPIEFDKTTSPRAATANWDNQKWTTNQSSGIFNLVLSKSDGGTNDYLLDTITEILIGNLYFKVKKTAPISSSKMGINRNYTTFLSTANDTELALEQLTFLTLTPAALNVSRPVPVITGATSVCTGQTTVLSASGGTSYSWSNGITSSSNRVGAGTYTVTAKNNAGCTATQTATVTALPLPVVAIAGATSVCSGQTTNLTASGGVAYKWNNAATTPSVTVAAGNYTVTVTSAENCTASKTVSVTSNPLPVVSIAGSLNVCTGQTTILTASGGATYAWSSGETTPSVTVGAGTYTVTATSTAGCTTTKTVTVLSNPYPIADITGASSVCSGLKTVLTASGGTTYKWSNGSSASSITVAAGTYTVTATSDKGCASTKTAILTSDPLPVVAIAGATSVCIDQKTVLTASGGATYAWSNAEATPSVTVGAGAYSVTATSDKGCVASKSITVTNSIITANITGTLTVCGTATTGLTASGGSTYKWSNGATTNWISVSAGTYTVTATNALGCTSTKTVTVISNPVPVVAIAGVTNICTGQTTDLTASGGATYKWSNAATTPSVTVGAGTYTVTVTSDLGCSATKSITVTTSPITANITGSTAVCGSATTILTASGGATYAWSNGASTPSVTVSGGTYTVTATNAIGCTSTKSFTIISNPLPIPAIAGASSVCSGLKTDLTASGGATYRWNSGLTTPSVTVGSGTYTVTVTSDKGCSATQTATVTSDPLPVIAITGATTVCVDATTVLTASGGATYAWSNSATTPSVTVGAGAYSVTATSDKGCVASKSITVTNSIITANITGTLTVCGTATTGLTASGGSTYKWSNGATTNWISVSAGTYTVTATNALGCTSTKTVTVISNPVPIVAISGVTNICTGQTTDLTASGGGTYKWNNAATTPTITVGAGSYTVTVTSDLGCTSTKSITVTANPITANITGTLTVCGTATTGLTASGGSTYKWSNGATTNWISVSAGTYTVTATNSIGCTSTKTVTVVSNPVPVAAISGITNICTGQTTDLTASGGSTYKWSNAATTPTITVGAGSYTVTVTSDLGCSATKSITVTTSPITANITGSTAVCGSATTILTASGGATYAWSNGASTPSVTVSGGTYTVTATNAIGCTSTKTFTVVSNPIPVPAIAGASSVCSGLKTDLTASGGATYKWNIGLTTPSVTVGAGTYTVTATSDKGCASTKTVTLTSDPLPVIAIAGATTVCTGATTVLTASGGATYTWSNGATTPSVTVSAGTYTVTATSAAGCTASKSITVTNSVVTPTITGTLAVCGNGTTSLRAAGGIAYNWNNGAATNPITVNAGTYTVTVINSLGCTATQTATVISNPLPVVDIAGATNVCTVQTTDLTASGGTTYKWSNAATTATIVVGAGTYTVTATNASGCTASKSFTIQNTSKPAGTACNDGNPNTINDVIQADGCTCLGRSNTSPNQSAIAGTGTVNYTSATKLANAMTDDNKTIQIPTTDFHIFPNPASDYIDVDLRQYAGKSVTLQLYDNFGKLRSIQQIEKTADALIHLELSQQVSGQYLLRVTTQDGKDAVKKFIILH